MNMQQRKKIYKYKKYPHLDAKLHWHKVYKYIENPDKIIHHGFYPFLQYVQKYKRYPHKYISGQEDKRDKPKLIIM